MHGNYTKKAIIVQRGNTKCQFLVKMSEMVCIAESTSVIEGCFTEFLSAILPCKQKLYHEDGFKEWLWKMYKFRVTYNDGLVILLERK